MFVLSTPWALQIVLNTPPSPPPQKKKPTLKSSHQFSDYCTDLGMNLGFHILSFLIHYTHVMVRWFVHSVSFLWQGRKSRKLHVCGTLIALLLALSLISKGEAGYLSLLIKNTLTKLCTSLPPYSQYVIRQAVACNEGHLFCRTCLREWIKGHGHRNCPVGRQPLQASDVRGIITFDKVVDSLQVYCPRRTEGCNWTGALETISGHQQQCLHEPIQCTHRGCSQTFPRDQMQRHAGECDMRPQECGYCGVTLPFWQYHDHQELACRKAPVMCPFNCNLVSIPR